MLTRHARWIGLLALLGCTGHAPHASEPSPSPVPSRADVACTPRNDGVTDSLRVDVTDSVDQHATILFDALAPPGLARNYWCRDTHWTFVVHTIDPRAARDALDAGIDVLITADPAAVAYAATRPDYDSAPLAWNRLYLLVTPGQVTDSTRAPALRAELAADAVHAEARPAESAICTDTLGAGGPVPAGLRPRILYAVDDSVARALAERLVALADRPGAPVPAAFTTRRLHAIGVPPAVLDTAVLSGADVAYIREEPVLTGIQCLRGPWTLLSLIETRPRAIVRRAAARLSRGALGIIKIEAPTP